MLTMDIGDLRALGAGRVTPAADPNPPQRGEKVSPEWYRSAGARVFPVPGSVQVAEDSPVA